ncbi:methylenetetrahydrofolate reductase [Streptomyces sp. NPDC052042]|uniref:methylenetetrahydrofolate reductase n=1 Tax=Streptomyces sp. NPDC052042 TaxID=3365683 RepID=UPI0037D7E0A0
MNHGSTAPRAIRTSLLDDFSLEMTGKDIAALEEARLGIPPGTRVNVTFLGNESLTMRLDAARAVKRLGFVPVPHVSARRLGSQADLEHFLSGLRADGAGDNVFVVGGDPARAEGPFEDSLAVIETGKLQEYGVSHIGIAGYPEGHPDIDDAALWTALQEKCAALLANGMSGSIITQFGFDTDPVLRWIEEVRQRGIALPIRIGVPGPAGIRRLLSYAARFGVGTSASIARKYGLSLTNLMGTAGPDRFLRDLSLAYAPARHGDIKVHFYTFGGLKATSEWIGRFRTGCIHES